jgi:hypothetical protein
MSGVASKAKFRLDEPSASTLAAMESGKPLLDLLLSYGASTKPATPYGGAPLIAALDIGYIPFVEALLASGADPNLPDLVYGNALGALKDRAGDDFQRKRDAALAELLRKYGAVEVEMPNHNGG